MSIYSTGYTGPILPPVAGNVPYPDPRDYARTRRGRYVYSGPTVPAPEPPWLSPGVTMMPEDLPPTDEMVAASTALATPYTPGPFCFGLDKYVCESLPKTIVLGRINVGMLKTSGVEIPVQGFCGALLNTICGVMVAIIILTLLGIAFYGLASDA